MSWRVEFRPEVEQDMAEAASWYESRQPGLGTEFILEKLGSALILSFTAENQPTF